MIGGSLSRTAGSKQELRPISLYSMFNRALTRVLSCQEGSYALQRVIGKLCSACCTCYRRR